MMEQSSRYSRVLAVSIGINFRLAFAATSMIPEMLICGRVGLSFRDDVDFARGMKKSPREIGLPKSSKRSWQALTPVCRNWTLTSAFGYW